MLICCDWLRVKLKISENIFNQMNKKKEKTSLKTIKINLFEHFECISRMPKQSTIYICLLCKGKGTYSNIHESCYRNWSNFHHHLFISLIMVWDFRFSLFLCCWLILNWIIMHPYFHSRTHYTWMPSAYSRSRKKVK